MSLDSFLLSCLHCVASSSSARAENIVTQWENKDFSPSCFLALIYELIFFLALDRDYEFYRDNAKWKPTHTLTSTTLVFFVGKCLNWLLQVEIPSWSLFRWRLHENQSSHNHNRPNNSAYSNFHLYNWVKLFFLLFTFVMWVFVFSSPCCVVFLTV
jgi:hypothetical protein